MIGMTPVYPRRLAGQAKLRELVKQVRFVSSDDLAGAAGLASGEWPPRYLRGA